jgi:hypothetical protein
MPLVRIELTTFCFFEFFKKQKAEHPAGMQPSVFAKFTRQTHYHCAKEANTHGGAF